MEQKVSPLRNTFIAIYLRGSWDPASRVGNRPHYIEHVGNAFTLGASELKSGKPHTPARSKTGYLLLHEENTIVPDRKVFG